MGRGRMRGILGLTQTQENGASQQCAAGGGIGRLPAAARVAAAAAAVIASSIPAFGALFAHALFAAAAVRKCLVGVGGAARARIGSRSSRRCRRDDVDAKAAKAAPHTTALADAHPGHCWPIARCLAVVHLRRGVIARGTRGAGMHARAWSLRSVQAHSFTVLSQWVAAHAHAQHEAQPGRRARRRRRYVV